MATLLRLQLRRNGYDPVPLIGKAPVLKDWSKWIDTPEGDILNWSKRFPGAINTGVLTRLAPTLDLDILDEDAVGTIEALVRARYGQVAMRIGRPPKLAIPFQTNEPFSKIIANLTAPDGTDHKIEFLGNGQQVVVDGIHPDTRKPYLWSGGDLTGTPREELPTICEATARELVDAITATLSAKHGYRLTQLRSGPRPLISPSTSNGDDRAGATPSFLASDAKTKPVPLMPKAELPKALYHKVLDLVPLSDGVTRHDQRRVIGLLRTVTEKNSLGSHRNGALYWVAFQFRELISAGIVEAGVAERLLLDATTLNGYVAKDGPGAAIDTIRSGLGINGTGLVVDDFTEPQAPDEGTC